MLSQSNISKLVALVDKALPKCESRPDVHNELLEIRKKLLEQDTSELLIIDVDDEDLEQINLLMKECEKLYKEYVQTVTHHLEELERIKKEMSSMVMYLANFKDKLIIKAEYLEEVFKKEISVKIIKDIEAAENISFTQAEKKLNADTRYIALRKEIYGLKELTSTIKTKYDFFSKCIQSIIQSISVAGKETILNK